MRPEDAIETLTPTRLRAVQAVAATGSFSDAAVRLGTSQSSVSRAVAAVESALDARLFDRSTRMVRLTDTGRDFVDRAALVTAELEAAIRAATPEHDATPTLTLASLTSISEVHLPVALAGLGSTVPRLRCIEGLQSVVEDAIASGEANAGLGDTAHLPDSLTSRPLWHERLRLVVPRRHRLARRRRATLDDFATDPLVGFSRDAELRSTLDRQLVAARRLRRPELEVDRFRTALGLVESGLGVMVVPSIVSVAVPAGATMIDLDHEELHRTIGLLHRRGERPPRRLRPIVDRLVTIVSERSDVTLA